ncbi:MAG: VCBS repeat-containing protein [Anaerolineales bacterium]
MAGGYKIFIAFDDTSPRISQVYLADLNRDDHLDAFLVFLNELHKVLLNDGHGNFTRNQELLMHNYVLALGDINGDGQTDAILSLFEFEENRNFIACNTDLPDLVLDNPLNAKSLQPFAIQDSNQDGIPESFIAGCCRSTSTLISYGDITNGSQCLETSNARALTLADLNGDKALDAFVTKGWVTTDGKTARRVPNEVWFNDGSGNFYDSGQRLGQAESYSVVLGDVNGDGFTDAVVGNRGADEIWLNDGQGNFSDSGQRLGNGFTQTVYLAQLDGDSDLDLYAVGKTSGRVWLNDGDGQFLSGQRSRFGRTKTATIGDVTGDGVIDILVVGVKSYQVWQGDGDGHFTAGSYTDF